MPTLLPVTPSSSVPVSRRGATRRWALRPCLALLLLPAAAGAQSVPHEYFVYDEVRGPGRSDGIPDLPEPGLSVAGPSASGASDGVPELDARGVVLPAEIAQPGDGGGRNGASPGEPVRLDDDTDREGMLRYVEIYSPSVAPWKRGRVVERIERDELGYVLLPPREPPAPMEAGGQAALDDLLFEGVVSLSGETGSWLPLPSVSPDMQVRSARTSSGEGVQFARDSADNWFVRADGDGGTVLWFTVSAAPGYFGGDYPAGQPPTGPEGVPAELVRDAHLVAEEWDVDPEGTDAQIIAGLAHVLRGFDGRPFDGERTDNLYLDIARAGVGVCRHRAFVFVLTAQGLGVRARYVTNEAHAFAEAWIRGHGWRRFDLGGEADGLEILSRDGAPPDAPPDDGLETPRQYQRQYSSRPELAGQRTLAGSNRSGTDSDETTGGEPPSEEASANRLVLADLPPGPGEPIPFLPPPPGQPQVVRMTTLLRIRDAPPRAYQGDSIEVSGRLIDSNGVAVPGAGILLVLGPRDSSDPMAEVVPLGDAITGTDGRFEITIEIPSSVQPGDWAIWGAFFGNSTYEPSRSD